MLKDIDQWIPKLSRDEKIARENEATRRVSAPRGLGHPVPLKTQDVTYHIIQLHKDELFIRGFIEMRTLTLTGH